jgi:ABC-type lipoprotein release transport system permease subunit
MFGIWAGLAASGISLGLSDETVDSALRTRLAHVQVHHPGFRDTRNLKDTLSSGAQIAHALRGMPGIRAVAGRVVADGMASTAETALGVRIYGVNPEEEVRVSSIRECLTAGVYAPRDAPPTVVVGEELALKLGVRLRSKIVLTLQDLHGTITGASFRVAGMFRTDAKPFDETAVFVDRRSLVALTGVDNGLHELAIVLDDPAASAATGEEIQKAFPDEAVESWADVAPDLRYVHGYTESFLQIFLGIIVLALLFGITNTMLMSVLDRVREFGVLIALGMRGRRIFFMIMMESVLLSALGAVLGMLAGWGTLRSLRHTGIDLSAFSDGLREWGYSPVSRPFLPDSMYLSLFAAVIVAAIVAALYPAWKAVRLDPARSLRTF